MPERGFRSGVQAQLSVRRGVAAVEFYRAAFGAVEVFRHGGDRANPEVVAQLAVGDGVFWVEDESPEHGNHSPESLGGASERMLLVVADPAAVQARALAAGAREVYPVAEQHGWLLGRVVDPFGHHWEIGRPLSVWPPAVPAVRSAPGESGESGESGAPAVPAGRGESGAPVVPAGEEG